MWNRLEKERDLEDHHVVGISQGSAQGLRISETVPTSLLHKVLLRTYRTDWGLQRIRNPSKVRDNLCEHSSRSNRIF